MLGAISGLYGHKNGLRLRHPTALYSATSQPTDHTFNFLTPTIGRWQRRTEKETVHGRPRLLKPTAAYNCLPGAGDQHKLPRQPVVHMRRCDPDGM